MIKTIHKKIGRNEILRIAIPSIVSNITVPLLALVDLTIVGHLGAAVYIAAIAIGGTIFNMLYWIFAFLRMGTTGITAQAYGAGRHAEVTDTLFRSLSIACLLGFLQIVFQYPIFQFAAKILAPEADVLHYAQIYFKICIWGAPAMLAQYCFFGWFIGVQEARYPLYVSILQNVINILCSFFFVYGLGWSVAGVAAGSLIAQYASTVLSIYYTRQWLKSNSQKSTCSLKELFRGEAIARLFQVNRDIFLRTLCLVSMTLYFTSVGTRQGEIILSSNVFLMQFFTFYSYFMDGFAYAGESLTGKYYGAANKAGLFQTFKHLFRWGIGLSIFFTVLYGVGGTAIISFLTDNQEVAGTAGKYLFWTVLIPFVSVWAFMWDGIYIGLTATRYMLISMFLAVVLFFLILHSGGKIEENHLLWFAFISYLCSRGVVQTVIYRKRIRPQLQELSR